LRREFCNVSFCFWLKSFSETHSQIYTNLYFLEPLAISMSRQDPSRRPSAEEALQQWRAIRGNMSFIRRHWRLRRRVEPYAYGFVLDIFYVLRSITRFVGLTS
jgi:hypothetical protein